jgi:2',3'-cyclic-nucleotide 2'-phosphodiesterase (5'-nucleotidase family)
MKKFLCSILFTTFLFPAAAQEKSLILVYTSSLNGYLDYCTCKADPKGGLVKRGTVFAKLRSDYKDSSIFFFDSGDICPVYSSEILLPYLFKAYIYLSYDALTFGDQDLDIGIPAFLNLSKGLPFINTNATFSGGQSAFPAYLSLTKKNVTAVILAVQSENAYRYSREATRNGLTINQAAASVRQTLAKIPADKHDIVILLSHAGYEEGLSFAEEYNGVDVIICGHSQTTLETPKKVNTTYILQAGPNGARIGVCKITLNKGRITAIKNSFIHPDMNAPEDDVYIRSLINEYLKKEGVQ